MKIRNIRYTSFVLHLLVLASLFVTAGAQDISQRRESLEKQRGQLQKEIRSVSNGLKQVRSSRHEKATELRVIQNKLELRNKLIKNLNSEISLINQNIQKAGKNIARVQKKLDTLRSEYAKMVVYEYKNRNNYNTLFFILSANSFNDALKRFQYLRQYRQYRDHEAERIKRIEQEMKDKLEELKEMKTKRSASLASAKQQKIRFVQEKGVKDSIIKTLKVNEQDLERKIAAKKKESRALSRKIVEVIRKQIEIARRKAAEEARRKAIAEARRRAASGESEEGNKGEASADSAYLAAGESEAVGSKSILNTTPEAKALSASFSANKGKLPWPVSHAVVSGLFGVHQHAVLSNITVDNDGVILQTNAGATVRSVFKGEVVAVRRISERWLVIVRHGEYFTVYANLAAATVSGGDHIGTGQPIGLAYTNPASGETKLDFKVYRGKNPVNPLQWLAGN